MSRKLLTILVPVFNEGPNIAPLHAALVPVFAELDAMGYDCELLFTDNHSTDDTFAQLQALADRDSRVRVLRFSRNFGFQRSILTGYLNARGDAAIQIDADLQDPPSLFPEFVRRWEAVFSPYGSAPAWIACRRMRRCCRALPPAPATRRRPFGWIGSAPWRPSASGPSNGAFGGSFGAPTATPAATW